MLVLRPTLSRKQARPLFAWREPCGLQFIQVLAPENSRHPKAALSVSEMAQIVRTLCNIGHVRIHTRTARNTTLNHPSMHSDSDTDPKHNKSRHLRTHLDQSRNCLYPLLRVAQPSSRHAKVTGDQIKRMIWHFTRRLRLCYFAASVCVELF